MPGVVPLGENGVPGATGVRGSSWVQLPAPRLAVQHARAAQRLVGRRDRRTAHPERGRQLALGGQAGLQREPAVEDEQAHPVGERVGEPAPVRWPPVAEQARGAAGADSSVDLLHAVHSARIGLS
jgi:hypothetical protein